MNDLQGETKIPMGSWLGDLGGYATDLITRGEALVDRYKGQAGAMADASRKILDAIKEFVAAPDFDTGATLYALVKAFPLPVMGAGGESVAAECPARMQAINWGNVAKFAEAIAGILAKFVV